MPTFRVREMFEGKITKNEYRFVYAPTRNYGGVQVMIFNWKGRPNKSSMFDQLAIITNAASEIGRPHRKRAFGHLIILLRDVRDLQSDEKTVGGGSLELCWGAAKRTIVS